MSGSIPIQIRGTPTPNNPPIGLAERQLAVEMATVPPRLWVGVPVSVNATGRLLLNDTSALSTQIGALEAGVAGGSQWQTLTKGAGTAYGWQTLGERGGNEVVVGSGSGAGPDTATIGTAATTQLWCGGRDLMVIGEPPAFGTVQNTIAGLPNDGSVQDIVSGTLGAGLWLTVVRVWMATSSGTPWYHYGAGLNTAPGQSSVADSSTWSTSAGSVYSAAFTHMNLFRLLAPTPIYGCTLGANGTNAGVYTTTITIEPFQLSS